MKLKHLFSTEQLLRGEVTRQMARAAGGYRRSIPAVKSPGAGAGFQTIHRAPGARAQ
jgi:hypothetical protein